MRLSPRWMLSMLTSILHNTGSAVAKLGSRSSSLCVRTLSLLLGTQQQPRRQQHQQASSTVQYRPIGTSHLRVITLVGIVVTRTSDHWDSNCDIGMPFKISILGISMSGAHPSSQRWGQHYDTTLQPAITGGSGRWLFFTAARLC